MSIENDLGRIASALERIANVVERTNTKTEAVEALPVKTAKKEKAVTPVEPPQAPAEPPPAPDVDFGGDEKKVTLEQVADGLRKVIKKDNNLNTQAIKFMVKYGANAVKPMVKDIKPENYADLLAEITAYLNQK